MIPQARERLATIGADPPVRRAAELMSAPHVELLVVCDASGRMAGVLTKTDIVGQISRCTGYSCTTSVDMVMSRDVVSCRPGERLTDVWSVMKERSLQRIPIIDSEGKPLGILYARDALQGLLGEVENEESLLRDYVMGIGYR